VRRACWFAVWWCVACGSSVTPPLDRVFSGDFILARESDWPGGQSCQYVIPVDQTVCSWGRLTVTEDSFASSVLGSDVHQGDRFGPLVHRDSVLYAQRFQVRDLCTVVIIGNTVKPNGPGVLSADSLQFAGYNLLGDTIRWVYAAVQVQRARLCG
jgi:hypothetical protein